MLRDRYLKKVLNVTVILVLMAKSLLLFKQYYNMHGIYALSHLYPIPRYFFHIYTPC